ncbi:DUF4298 domain-containing protein [Bacteroides heparinolyticus]|uniref:DUF4298 domain-containing protein n=1 Tax=Prevotella heparinolytica TaxID=28113 RepID=UPI000D03B524|nr:DUF4298 domain-containing protein [Bacteroides heparinolyticus]AVM56412.1 DUF4298 domain-containing protein [Bacteroides heparinolyticus]
MEKEDFKHVSQMESFLDRHSALLEQMSDLLERFDKSQEEYKQLREYYHSEQYLIDVQQADRGKIPAGVKCGVLSEDAVYNMIGDNYDTAVRMLEVATGILKAH